MAWTAPRTWVTAETVTAALLNAHVRDNLDASFPLTGGPTHTTWVPTYANLTVGDGTVTARYTQIGKLVLAEYMLLWGSTTSISGTVNVSLPVTSASTYAQLDSPIGTAQFLDDGSDRYLGTVSWNTTTTLAVQALNAATTHLRTASLSSTIPFTWTTNDRLAFTVAYEAA